MTRYSVQPRDRIFVKGQGFSSFARNFGLLSTWWITSVFVSLNFCKRIVVSIKSYGEVSYVYFVRPDKIHSNMWVNLISLVKKQIIWKAEALLMADSTPSQHKFWKKSLSQAPSTTIYSKDQKIY